MNFNTFFVIKYFQAEFPTKTSVFTKRQCKTSNDSLRLSAEQAKSFSVLFLLYTFFKNFIDIC